MCQQEAQKAPSHFAACRCDIYYSIIALVSLLAASTQVCLWSLAAERQVKRIRILYFHRVMRQEISWFDVMETGELNTRLAEWVAAKKKRCSESFFKGFSL